MTLTILRIMYLRLRNNPAELLLVLVLPVVFFSIFAAIFSKGIATGTDKPLRVGWVAAAASDTVSQQLSIQLLEALRANASLVCSELAEGSSAGTTLSDRPLDDAAAEQLALEAQKIGNHDLIVRIPSRIRPESAGDVPSVILLTDGQNPMAIGMVSAVIRGFFAQWSGQQSIQQFMQQAALLQQLSESNNRGDSEIPGTGAGTDSHSRSAVSTARHVNDVFRDSGGDEWIRPSQYLWSEDAGGFVDSSGNVLTAQARGLWPRPPDTTKPVAPGWLKYDDRFSVDATSRQSHPPDFLSADEAVQIVVRNPQSADQSNPRIAMYAAGIAVLFLLFSATGNAATLLEEAESGTLDRILTSRAGLLNIVAGKWIGIFLLGCLQITVMFVWADQVYDIQFSEHIPGFCIMTACTAAATASFAMLLATLCRSRAQLNAASVVIILSMSAVGGSMIPRFAMSDRMKEIGQWTFNAWALDGYQKVFWYQQPLDNLRDEVLALAGSALVLGVLALLFSLRWKRA